MQRPWFKCQPADEAFFDSAPLRLSETFEIERSAERVWAEQTAEDPLSWCRILNGITWTSPRPFGVGTTRTVKSLAGTSVFHETYFRWEEGRRKSFYVVEASAPLFNRFAEDYLVEPVTESSCRFTWTIAVEPKRGMQLGNPLNKLILGTLLTDTRKHYGVT